MNLYILFVYYIVCIQYMYIARIHDCLDIPILGSPEMKGNRMGQFLRQAFPRQQLLDTNLE